ncbi:DUF6497 family protein [Aliiroseovarius subalbicans]|uniref:DUF6497 family protein n=1 Tax=Aliiroseovarius subalbicans TaxID=2925840 RepID=UPI001F57632A|nr:DUF6497 family protein [Aliiroseovarius subalbicans]MCI2400763.1 DUF6497 family protein [Aliiroseovarius subalbicans]
MHEAFTYRTEAATWGAIIRQPLAALCVGVVLSAPAGAGEKIRVPSGQDVTFQDAIWGEPGATGLAVRFRFVAPRIARTVGDIEFLQAEEDMVHLCETFALPRVASTGPRPAQIIISLSDRVIEFGLSDPEATQFFEAYRPDGESCVWEGF